ncbi:MAG TPA: catalase family protein [Bradyrhizobium sp.]|nr:catalase family protein [Bradyrhizobium sp.]
MLLRLLHRIIEFLLHVERRFEQPFLRPAFNLLFREPLARLLTTLINLGRSQENVALAEETLQPGEDEAVQTMIDEMRRHLVIDFPPGGFERAGNTKTHGLVRGELTIHDDLPACFRYGLFATPKTYQCWVRFSGPGPHIEPDIDDVGFISISVKVMGVEGEKLWNDEKYTQDFTGVCTPTFVTPDVKANARLQYWSRRHLPAFYFLDVRGPHLLDMAMQGLWNETQTNPLGATFYSCVPYLLGPHQAMQYSFRSKSDVYRRIPRLPFRPPDNYLRDNMIRTLDEMNVEFEMRIQLQKDAFLMPIENNAVLWPERLSPRVPVATLQIPRQKFDSPAQFAFTRNLKFNPWHCLPDHRPLGNQSRARKRMYDELSGFRQKMNGASHIEPTGNEQFDGTSTAGDPLQRS